MVHLFARKRRQLSSFHKDFQMERRERSLGLQLPWCLMQLGANGVDPSSWSDWNAALKSSLLIKNVSVFIFSCSSGQRRGPTSSSGLQEVGAAGDGHRRGPQQRGWDMFHQIKDTARKVYSSLFVLYNNENKLWRVIQLYNWVLFLSSSAFRYYDIVCVRPNEERLHPGGV